VQCLAVYGQMAGLKIPNLGITREYKGFFKSCPNLMSKEKSQNELELVGGKLRGGSVPYLDAAPYKNLLSNK